MTGYKDDRQLAFEQQALVHADALYRFGLRLTKNAADADDLVQETYLKAYRFWDKYDQGTNIRAWLFRILKNSFINVCRKESRKPDKVVYSETTGTASSRHVPADAHGPEEPNFGNLLDDDVSGAVSGLPEDFRIVVILCDIEGLTYEEIARFVNCPVGTVRSRLHRGRKLLHVQLYEYARGRGYVPSGLRAPSTFPRSPWRDTESELRCSLHEHGVVDNHVFPSCFQEKQRGAHHSGRHSG